jgi:hypothetical protein
VIQRAIQPKFYRLKFYQLKFYPRFPATRIEPIGKTLRRHDAAAETYLIVDI